MEAYEMQIDCMMSAEEFWSEMDLEVDPFFYSAVWQFVGRAFGAWGGRAVEVFSIQICIKKR
jgi:hypothetical protein